MGLLPMTFDSATTLVGSSGLAAAQARPREGLRLELRSLRDDKRAGWERQWGFVEEEHYGDWSLVKWVTSRHPVFTAAEILVLAGPLLADRGREFPEEEDAEALLMRLLRQITILYRRPEGAVPSRMLDTLLHYNVGHRLQNILSGSKTLDGVPEPEGVEGVEGAEAADVL